MISLYVHWYVFKTEAFCLHSMDFALTLLQPVPLINCNLNVRTRRLMMFLICLFLHCIFFNSFQKFLWCSFMLFHNLRDTDYLANRSIQFSLQINKRYVSKHFLEVQLIKQRVTIQNRAQYFSAEVSGCNSGLHLQCLISPKTTTFPAQQLCSKSIFLEEV